jgi:hypothetical protein
MTEQEKFLREVALPQHAETYTVISHGHIIDKVRGELDKNGFKIQEEKYQYTKDGQIALATVYLESTKDSQMGMIFTWWNSYNKQVKFGCAVGSFIYDNNASLIGSEGMSWIRKHTGTADQEADTILEQLISHANVYFDKLIEEKNQMINQPLSIEDFGCVMGALYFEHELITPNQASAIRKEYKNEEKEYTHKDTLWGLYKLLMFGIDGMDIKKWVKSQQKLHHMIMTEYAIKVELPAMEQETLEVDEDNLVDSPEKLAAEMTGEEPKMEVVDPQPELEVSTVIDGQVTPIESVEDLSEVDSVTVKKELPKEDAVRLACEQTHAPALVDYWMKEHYIDSLSFDVNVATFKGWAPEASKEEPKAVELDTAAGKVVVTNPTVLESNDEGPLVSAKTVVLDFGEEASEKDELTEWAEEAKEVSPLPETIVDESAIEIEESVEETTDEFEAQLDSLFTQEPGESTEEVKEEIPAVKPVANLDKPVEIMSPEEAKEKAEDILDIKEHDGLKAPEGVVAQASVIEKKMKLLYESVRPYQVEETDTQINVTIDETLESFYIKK